MREQSSHRSHKLENGSSGKSYKYKFLKWAKKKKFDTW
jgi:hypothetical protein